jgi:capsular polysaccharide transport system permease protein
MVAWLPANLQPYLLAVPFVHPIEMIRAAVFGEFVETHFNPPYAILWSAIFTILGLALVLSSRDRIETE